MKAHRLVFPLALLLAACGLRAGSPYTSVGGCAYLTSTFDGYPTFAGPENGCAYAGAVQSDDGHNTYEQCLSAANCFQSESAGGYACTELAFRYFRFAWQVTLPSGDAAQLCPAASPALSGATFVTHPVRGDLAVISAGSCGAGSAGHVAVVNNVQGDGSIDVVEQNWGTGQGSRKGIAASCFCGFIHAASNQGA